MTEQRAEHASGAGDNPPRVAPNRLAVDPASDYYDAAALKGLSVYINGQKCPGNVVEYSMSEGWARCYLTDGRGNPKRERGRLVPITKRGEIVAKYD